MEFKGTKGKWSHDGGNILACHVDEEDYGIVIASVEFDPYLKSGQAEANALLISKAPELLEILMHIDENALLSEFPSMQENVAILIKQATEI